MSEIRLQDGTGQAAISHAGAELKTWRVGGTDLIWVPDPLIWADTAPILFPVVGWTRDAAVTVDGRRFPLGLHGFARHRLFRVVEQSPAHVRMRCEADTETQALYPFDWWLEIDYRLKDASLKASLAVGNHGHRTMPYACGFHPGFRWPFTGGAADDYAILFEAGEAAEVPVISPEGLFARENRGIPIEGRRLSLSTALMGGEALCFLKAQSRRLSFVHGSGASLDCAFDDLPHLALWSRPPGRFLSIEAWTGHGDFVDAAGDLFAKPSMRYLAPGATGIHAATYSFRAI